MSVQLLSAANGADLLQKLQESAGQAPPSATSQKSADVLQTAIQEAKLSESSVANGGDPLPEGSLLNVYG